MAFWSNLKAAFGFSDEESEEEVTEKFLPYEAQHRTPYINPFKKDEEVGNSNIEAAATPPDSEEDVQQPIQPVTVPEVVEEDLPVEMYNGVLSIINSTIPTFIRECLDVEAEKRAIAKALGPHIKKIVARQQEQIEARAIARWNNQRADLTAQIEQAQAASREAADRMEQAQSRAQAADTQRKAVAERCKSLESRVAELEAEREQFDLENKSLLNKVKVAQVHAADAEHYREQVQELQQKIVELKTQLATGQTVDPEEEARRQEELAAKTAEIEQLAARVKTVEEQLAAVGKERDEALVALEIASEVQEKVDLLGDQIKARDEKIADLNDQLAAQQQEALNSLNEATNARLDLKLKYDLLKAEAQKLQQALDNAEADKAAAVAEQEGHTALAQKGVEELRAQVANLKEQLAEAQTARTQADADEKERMEGLRKQVAAAAALVEERDNTISELNARVAAMQGEISFSKSTEKENRLKIKKLAAELEAEQARSISLAEKLEQLERVQDQLPAEPADIAMEMPEPELAEAVSHSLNIDINGPQQYQVAPEEPPMQVAAEPELEPEPDVAEEAPQSLPFDTLVEPVNVPSSEPASSVVATPTPAPEPEPVAEEVVEPAEPSPTPDVLNNQEQVNDTFAQKESDLPDLDDDIEWLMPQATEKVTNRATIEPKHDDDDGSPETPPQKHEPQQMSLF